MLVYVLTGLSVLGCCATVWLARYARFRGTVWASLLHNFAFFLIPFALAGSLFSALQFWIQHTDNYENTSRTIRVLETRLAELRSIADFLKLSTWVEVLVASGLIILFSLPLFRRGSSFLKLFARYTSLSTQLYIWTTLFVSLTLFGSVTAGSTLAEQIVRINNHIDRIDARYSVAVDSAVEPLLAQIVPAAVEIQQTTNSEENVDCRERKDSWSCVVFAWTNLEARIDRIQRTYPSLFDPPTAGPKPSGPTAPSGFPRGNPTWKPRPLSGSALQVHPRQPLDNLKPMHLSRDTVGALAERKRRGSDRESTLSASKSTLRAETTLADFEGRIRQAAKQPSLVDVVKLKQIIASSVVATRPEWCEDGAAELERQLAEGPQEKIYKNNTEVLASIGGQVMGGIFSDRVDAVLSIFKEDAELGIPLGFLSAFTEAVINETGKEKIAEIFKEHLANWLSRRQNLRSTIEKFKSSSADFFRSSSELAHSNGLRKVREKIGLILDREQASDVQDVVRFSDATYPARWSGFSTVWLEAVDRLPITMKQPTNDLLKAIEEKVVGLPHIERSRLLTQLENVWAEPARNDPLSYVSAMLRCETIALGSQSTSFAERIGEEIIELLKTYLASDHSEINALMRGFNDEYRKTLEIAELGLQRHRQSKDVERRGLDKSRIETDFIENRKNIIDKSGQIIKANFILLSRRRTAANARQSLVSALSRGCSIEWTVTTHYYVNGIERPPPTVTHFTTNCF